MAGAEVWADLKGPGNRVDGRSSAQRFRVLAIGMVALTSLVAFESFAVTTAMPTVAQALDGLSLYPLAFGGTLAAGVVSMVLSGRWCDLAGPSAPLRAGVAVFVAGLLVAGAAPTMWLLVLGRITQGLGGGLMSVALYVVVGREISAALRPRVFALLAGAWLVPSIVGPAFAGGIVQHAGWRWVFFGVALLAVPAAALVLPRVRRRGEPARNDRPVPTWSRLWWAIGVAAAAVLVQYGGQREGLVAVLLIVTGTVCLVGFTPRLLPPGTFAARPGLPSVIALRGVAGAAMAATEIFVPLLLVRERGLTPSVVGLILATGAIGWFTGSWVQGRTADRWPPTRWLITGMTIMVLGVAATTTTVASATPIAVCVMGLVLLGVGMGVIYPVLPVVTLSLSAPHEQGTNTSALQLSESLFVTATLAFTGVLFAAWLSRSAGTAYLAGFVPAQALALLGVLVARRTRLPAGVLRHGTGDRTRRSRGIDLNRT
ncbi:MFS transporter [Salinispora vitiensis]|uniref:MFS transporter n=1 Tax=Salinispora vitiensis TaxID=999544 RepID=UPI000373C798|nr:MFS transporter [Salinispora vitiensis]